MFLQDFQVVDRPFGEVVERFTVDAEALLGGALDTARSEGERLRVRVGPPTWPALVAKTVEIRSGPVRVHGGSMLLPFTWEASGGASLFPRLDADIGAAPLGADRTEVVLRGSYDPPGGALGRAVDQLLLHRVAQSTVRAFLTTVCEGLDSAGDAPPED